MSRERLPKYSGSYEAPDLLPTAAHASAYSAICRHFQFSDFHNGTWYVEVLGTADPRLFIVQEVRDGFIVRRSRTPIAFTEARKIYWDRSHRMSLEAGIESAPPLPVVLWSER